MGNKISHYLSVKTTVKNPTYLKNALKRMGIFFEEGNNLKIQSNGRTAEVDLKMDQCIGMKRQQDGTWTLVGDPYYSQRMKKYYTREKQFTSELNVAYGLEETKDVFESQGFFCSENSEAAVVDNKIQMVYTRY